MIVCDFECASACDLKNFGGRVYAVHESTKVLCFVMKHEGTVHYWVPGTTCKSKDFVHNGPDMPDYMVELAKTHGLIAHNSRSFDSHIWDQFVGVPVTWYDSIDYARMNGYPAGLDKLCKSLGLSGKDSAGSKVLKACMTLVKRGNKYTNPLIGAGSVKTILRYCIQDVQELEEALTHLDRPGAYETHTIQVHCAVNERGIEFDESLAAKISAISNVVIEDAKTRIHELTEGKIRGFVEGKKSGDLRSPSVMYPWLESQGIKFQNLRRNTIDNWIANPIVSEDAPEGVTPKVIDVLRLRQCALRITGAKLEKASAACLNGRLQDLYIYHGAHTGRFSSRLVQVHNLPRGLDGLNIKELCGNLTSESVFSEAERLSSPARMILPDDVLSSLIRPCFFVKSVADFNAIEVRVIAWLSGAKNLMQKFVNHEDPYLDLASILFNKPCTKADKALRQVAKVVLLGSQYQLGPKTLNVYAASNGIDLQAAGLTSEQCIEAYRSLYPDIAGHVTGVWNGKAVRKHGFWQNLAAAWKLAALERETSEVGPLTFEYHNNTVRVRLPSSRFLHYRNPRIEPRPAPWNEEQLIPTMLFDGVHGETSTHGGKLAENVTQAVARDPMVEALIEAEKHGLRPVIHSHDEIACESADLDALLQIMSITPAWAPGLPIVSEGFRTTRYAKGPV